MKIVRTITLLAFIIGQLFLAESMKEQSDNSRYIHGTCAFIKTINDRTFKLCDQTEKIVRSMKS